MNNRDRLVVLYERAKEEYAKLPIVNGSKVDFNYFLADHFIANGVTFKKHGEWFLLDECSNEGVYCSVCHKKVYDTHYANQKIKSKFCPNCGARMDGQRKENGVTVPVRCKDCKYHYWEQEPCHGKTEHFCSVLKAQVFADFYCYHGQRKENGDE